MAKLEKKPHEPLFHIVKRDALPWWMAWLIRLASVAAALIVCGVVIMLMTGNDPLKVYATMIDGAIGTDRRIWMLLQSTAILLCIALAVTPAFKMRFWNIGAEGQVLMGGLAATTCMLMLGDKLPAPWLMVLIVVSSVLTGAVWALIPAIFKAQWNTNETLFTLMMNYIAIQLVAFFVIRWAVPKGSGKIGVINSVSHAGWFPEIAGQKYLLNVLIVAALTLAVYIYLRYSKHGYEIAVVGESENTARYVGINVKKVVIRTMAISGAICGLAGLLLVSGTDHTITRETAGGRGFTAIIVSWMAKFNPLFMVLTSLLIVFLQKGAGEISTTLGLNSSFSDIITGIIIFFIIGGEFFVNYGIMLRHKEKGGEV